ncbi:MAG: nuclear transport factor 2 family protein [Acidimicrobiia bacterium]|nr:nuclear transport factor 2 family protein [Acidimicrobiia bacterium]
MQLAHLEAATEALERLDVEALVAHYAADFVFEDVAADIAITTREELRRYYGGLFSMPGVAFTDVYVFVDDSGRGGGEWTWSGFGEDGNPFSIRGASIFEVEDSGITRETIYYLPPHLRSAAAS